MTSPPNEESLFSRLRRHKVLQWVLAYGAASFTLLQVTDVLSGAFDWPRITLRVLAVVLALGLGLVIALAWYHGHKGAQRVSTGELVVVSAVLVAAACVLWVFGRPATSHAPQATVTAPPAAASVAPAKRAPVGKPRIAILPFENQSPDPNNAFFADGLHEEVLATLANSARGLDVISRTTILTYRAAPKSVQQIAKELSCTYVLAGSVRRAGNRVRLALQLIDARTDTPLWSQDYQRTLTDALTLQSEVAMEISAQLPAKLTIGAPANAPQTKDPQAYDLYLRARLALSQLASASPEKGWRDVETLLDQAIERDPGFVHAYVQRIGVRVALFLWSYDSEDVALQAARKDLETARRLASTDPAVISAEAQMAFAEMRYDRALELFESAEAAGLADPTLLTWKPQLLFALGRYREVADLNQKLAALDPANLGLLFGWAFALAQLHDPQATMRVGALAIARFPQIPDVQGMRAGPLFQFGGNLQPLSDLFRIVDQRPPSTEVGATLQNVVYQLELEQRFDEALHRIDATKVDALRYTAWDWPLMRVGLTPRADPRGWLNLLRGDRREAAKDGQAILGFLKKYPENRWNKWHRALLRADAQLFTGDGAAANATASGAVALTGVAPDVSDRMNARVWATQIMSWTDAKDDAAARLESFSESVPGLFPGEITGNPLFSMPLAGNARYVALRERLLARMKATRLE